MNKQMNEIDGSELSLILGSVFLCSFLLILTTDLFLRTHFFVLFEGGLSH